MYQVTSLKPLDLLESSDIKKENSRVFFCKGCKVEKGVLAKWTLTNKCTIHTGSILQGETD